MKSASLLVLLFIVTAATNALAAPKADLWQKWTAHDPASTVRVDHAAWGRFLALYVVPGSDGINRVAYGLVAAEDRARLDAYIDGLATVAVGTLNRDEQLAYWINLYNALTVRVVLDHYPVDSIRDIDISPGFFADGPWGKKLVRVDGEEISLDDIEHRILRPIWRDPRIHYAVNCASLGCPNLQPFPYEAATVSRMLEAAARVFIASDRAVFFEGDKLGVSKIYDWFADDFGRTDAEVIAHIAQYAPPELNKRLAGQTDIDMYRYDWQINDAS